MTDLLWTHLHSAHYDGLYTVVKHTKLNLVPGSLFILVNHVHTYTSGEGFTEELAPKKHLELSNSKCMHPRLFNFNS